MSSLVYIANNSRQTIGGGWSFIGNIKKALPDMFTDQYEKADVYFIPSASMIDKESVRKAKDDGKRIILRVDNVLRNSRNRNTGMSRMKLFTELADEVIYQSRWARDYLSPYLGKEGKVILNSVDEEIFKDTKQERNGFIYSRFNRDETKNWEMARYIFSQVNQLEPEPQKLYIIGQFSPELIEYNFDFYNNEDFEYLGVIKDPSKMADIYNLAENFIFTYFNDACSNTLIEALMCGCKILDPFGMVDTGGSAEIVYRFDTRGRDYFKLERMAKEYSVFLSPTT